MIQADSVLSTPPITEAAELDHYRYSEDWLLPLIANLCEALQTLGIEGGSDAQG
jgi:hypothetical protein